MVHGQDQSLWLCWLQSLTYIILFNVYIISVVAVVNDEIVFCCCRLFELGKYRFEKKWQISRKYRIDYRMKKLTPKRRIQADSANFSDPLWCKLQRLLYTVA
jgi:hypothetical protein